MTTKIKTAITPTRAEDYPNWYQAVVDKAELAEMAVVRGCMVIKPWGYAIWENIQKTLDAKLKATGHENLYCPLFVPLRLLEKEAAHVEGFAKECAVGTHHRLEADGKGGLKPAGLLEEPLIVRPTSEAIVGELFARWVQSYRDLPLLMNQWANVVRWEMRPRIFLRTTEFLWQEGHTVHATAEEAIAETEKILGIYVDLVENYLAIPVVQGKKTASERFPGAEDTYTFEAMMQDKKALQAGTSHFLGQNFAKAFNIKFLDQNGQTSTAWTSSWGVTTRLIGALIMTHSDDDGLVLPPRIAPLHVVILPLLEKAADPQALLDYCTEIKTLAEKVLYHGQPVQVKIDTTDGRTGDKAWRWIKKGAPIRLEIGSKELEQRSVYMGRRDKSPKDKQALPMPTFIETLASQLDELQNNLYVRAKTFLQTNTVRVESREAFYAFFDDKNAEQGGFALIGWGEDPTVEAELKQTLKVTPRCIPLETENETVPCLFTGKPGRWTIFAKSY